MNDALIGGSHDQRLRVSKGCLGSFVVAFVAVQVAAQVWSRVHKHAAWKNHRYVGIAVSNIADNSAI